MRDNQFLRNIFGHWIFLIIPILYIGVNIKEIITTGHMIKPWGTLHMTGLLILCLIYRLTDKNNQKVDEYASYFFGILLIGSWFAYN